MDRNIKLNTVQLSVVIHTFFYVYIYIYAHDFLISFRSFLKNVRKYISYECDVASGSYAVVEFSFLKL